MRADVNSSFRVQCIPVYLRNKHSAGSRRTFNLKPDAALEVSTACLYRLFTRS